MLGKKVISVFLIFTTLALFTVSMWITQPVSNAAPFAVVTPVPGGTGGNNLKVVFFSGNITADSRICFDLSSFNRVDLQWSIDQNTVNTTTLKLQWSNVSDGSGAVSSGTYEDLATFVTANAADTHSGNEYITAGQFNCVFADVTNSNALGLDIRGLAKP